MQAERHARSGGGARPEDPLIGRLLDGRYRIDALIARGGMAGVYAAHDVRLDRTVAVKVMHPAFGGGSTDEAAFASRFVGEARAAAKLSHPNVVGVYDQGDDHGTIFLAMELVRGETLRDVIAREAPMPPAKALAHLEPVLAALGAAHRAGLVHRDVKPENVLIAAGHEPLGSRVKVADFGLARAVSAQTQHTSSGVIIGTVSYIAPELVVEGRSDARADVYSAGVMLYELLTGEKPHAGETPIQVAYKHVHEDVPPPSSRVPGIPAYVDALVARATARDRSLRPADAGVFLHQARMVSRALADGVVDDPELVADLALPAAAIDPHDSDTGGDGERTAVLQAPAAPRRTGTSRIDLGDTSRTQRRQAPPRALERKPRRFGGLVIGVLALLLIAGGGTAVAIERDHIPFLNRVTMPGVSDDTPAQARQRLEALGLHVVDGPAAYSDNISKGFVIGTDPAAGSTSHKGDTVDLILSKGVEEYAIPPLGDKTQADATAALLAIKMIVTPKAVWSDNVASGNVVGTNPPAGIVLRPGHPVTLLVSKGRQPIHIRDWTHKSSKAAEKALSDAGLDPQATEAYDDTVPKGQVISMTPGADHTFYKGDVVSLTVSKGPHLVTIPSGLAGHSQDTVTHDLEALGFKVTAKETFPYFGFGLVVHVDNSGKMAPYGSTVTIYVS